MPGGHLAGNALQIVQLTGQLEALQQEHHRLTGGHVELEKQNALLQEECAQLQVPSTCFTATVLERPCFRVLLGASVDVENSSCK